MSVLAAYAGASAFPVYQNKPPAPLETENEEGIGYMPDLDEVAHAGYATFKNIGHGHITQDLRTQVALAHQTSPWASFSYDPVAHNVGGLVGVTAGSVFTMPPAYFAMKNGWKEWRESKIKMKRIDDHREDFEEELSYVGSIAPKTQGKLNEIALALACTSTLRIKRMDEAKHAAKLGGKIGKYSFLSGSTIMTRCFVEIGRNGVLFIAAPSAATGGAALLDAKESGKGPFTTTTGLVSNLLAPVAAIFALLLGVNFVTKTKISRNAWNADRKAVTSESRTLEKTNPRYHHFVVKK